MTFLEVPDLVAIAARVLNLDVEDVLDLTDERAAEAALSEARESRTPGREGHAAALLCALLKTAPFRRGNDPVAVIATLQFLALNGCSAELQPADHVRDVIDGIKSGEIGQAEVTEWLARRLVERRSGSGEGDRMFHRRGSGRRRAGGKRPFGRFTDRACESLTLAQEEARLLRHDYIGTEHLLLGLLRVTEGVAAKALEALGVSLTAVRSEVQEMVGMGERAPGGSIPLTPRTKKVLELSLREALQLGHNYVGTEHILLGILREGEGVAAQVLEKLGVELSRGRQEVIQLLARFSAPSSGEGLSLGEFEAAVSPAGSIGPSVSSPSALIGQIAAVFDENDRLRSEVERLRGVLRKHGIEPDGGETRTA